LAAENKTLAIKKNIFQWQSLIFDRFCTSTKIVENKSPSKIDDFFAVSLSLNYFDGFLPLKIRIVILGGKKKLLKIINSAYL
jgi:hypothetical protein